jgi:hypothetical protein
MYKNMRLRQELLENNCLIIPQFIPIKKAKELNKVFEYDLEHNPEIFTPDEQCTKSPAIYNYIPFLQLLVDKNTFISEVIQEPVLPTYTYARVYKHGEILKKHTDRHACEISVTLHLDSDGTEWPLWFTKPNGDIISCVLKSGDAVLYLGSASEHWREEFKGLDYKQVFLHYVRTQGENCKYYFDRNFDRS